MNDGTTGPGRRLDYIALMAFALVTAWLNLHHEPWHDELQAWRIALDSANLTELISTLRYEGHPPLFHLILRLVGAFSRSWTAAVVVHWLIACLSAWIVLWRAPFTQLQRILIVAGYFFVYEYAVIVRPYGLGMCLALGACAAWTSVPRRSGLAAVLLMLLATTSVMGLLLSVPLAIALVTDASETSRRGWWTDARLRIRVLLAGTTLAIIAVAVLALVVPPTDAIYQVSIDPFARHRRWMIGFAMSLPARVLLPLAEHGPDGATLWGSWLFPAADRADVVVAGIAGVLAIAIIAAVVSRRRAALLLWLASSVGLLGFFAFVFGGGIRHHGYLVVAFIAATWLAAAPRRNTRHANVISGGTMLGRLQNRTFTVLLACMVAPSVQFAMAELREPFSDARGIATLLSADSLAAAPIVGLSYPWSQAVAALLDRPVYFPAESRRSTWAARRNVIEGPAEMSLADSTVRVLLESHCRVVVLSSRRNRNEQFVWPGARELGLPRATPMADAPMRAWVVVAPRCEEVPRPGD